MRLFAALMLAALLRGQAPQSPASIRGAVLDAVTGEAVKGAEIHLVPAEDSSSAGSATSGEDGSYVLTGLKPGRYLLVVSREGYARSYGPRGSLSADVSFTLAPGEKKSDLVVRIQPHGVIAGRIEDGNGKPAAGAAVMAYRVSYAWGGKTLLQTGRAVAGPTGEYRIADLPDGRYYVNAVGDDAGVFYSYYPGTIDADTAVPLDLTSGNYLPNIDIRIVRPQTVCVRFVIDPPAEGISIALSARGSFAPGRIVIAKRVEDGAAQEVCSVVPGSYFATAMTPSRGMNREPVVIGKEEHQEFRLTLLPASPVSGRAVVEAEREPEVAGIRVVLAPAERGILPTRESELKDGQAFTLEDVNPAHYNVQVLGVPDRLYLKAIRSGSVDVLRNGLLLAGNAPEPLEIVLSPDTGSLIGTVLDARGERLAPAAIVVLVPEDEWRRTEAFYEVALADSAGAFTIPSVAPGSYQAYAFDEAVPSGALLDPEFLARLRDKAVVVEIAAKAPSSVRLKLTPAANLK